MCPVHGWKGIAVLFAHLPSPSHKCTSPLQAGRLATGREDVPEAKKRCLRSEVKRKGTKRASEQKYPFSPTEVESDLRQTRAAEHHEGIRNEEGEQTSTEKESRRVQRTSPPLCRPSTRAPFAICAGTSLLTRRRQHNCRGREGGSSNVGFQNR